MKNGLLRGSRAALKRLLIRFTWTPLPDYNPPFLWSKGISRHCDFRGPEAYWRQNTEACQPEPFFRRHYAGASGVVWVRLGSISRDGKTCDLDNFVRGALPTIRKPFVLSAAGNGLDSHRTWESLYLGAIVITKTSPLDRLFEGLPVVIVKDWSEVGDKGNLCGWLRQYATLTDRKLVRSRLDPGGLIESIRATLARP